MCSTIIKEKDRIIDLADSIDSKVTYNIIIFFETSDIKLYYTECEGTVIAFDEIFTNFESFYL